MGIKQRVATSMMKRAICGVSLTATVAFSFAITAVNPASADSGMSGAEKLRRLDIMLMVTALRCRSTPDNFTADYGDFTTSHMDELQQANAQLRAELSVQGGAGRADRELDRLSTTIANRYGQGHPWLNCAELKLTTRDLAQIKGRAALEDLADELLNESGPSAFASLRR